MAAKEGSCEVVTFIVHMMGQSKPITIDLPLNDMDALAAEAAHARYLVGHLSDADEEGVCRRVMIATCRIQVAVEATD